MELNATPRVGLAVSRDRAPFLICDGPGTSDAFIVTSTDADVSVRPYFQVINPTPTANETFDIDVTDGVVTVTLGSQNGVAASLTVLSDIADTLGHLILTADYLGDAGEQLKVQVLANAPDDASLRCYMGGSERKTLIINLGKTGSSTNSSKNTVDAIYTAVNAITDGKVMTATKSGTTTRKITVAAAATALTGGTDSTLIAFTADDLVDALNDVGTWPALSGVLNALLYGAGNVGSDSAYAVALTQFTNPTTTGSGVDTHGYKYADVFLILGSISVDSVMDVAIEQSDDNVTFVAITDGVTDAGWLAVGFADERTVKVGRLKLSAGTLKKYIRAVSTQTLGASGYMEHSVMFLLNGGQYKGDAETAVEWTY